MERDLDTIHQLRNAVRNCGRTAGIKILKTKRQTDKSTQNTKTGHYAGNNADQSTFHYAVNVIFIQIIINIALGTSL